MAAHDRQQGIVGRFVSGLREHDVSGLSAEMAYRFLFAGHR